MLHVHYVDDEADIREIVSIALSSHSPIHVAAVSSGCEALERLR